MTTYSFAQEFPENAENFAWQRNWNKHPVLCGAFACVYFRSQTEVGGNNLTKRDARSIYKRLLANEKPHAKQYLMDRLNARGIQADQVFENMQKFPTLFPSIAA